MGESGPKLCPQPEQAPPVNASESGAQVGRVMLEDSANINGGMERIGNPLNKVIRILHPAMTQGEEVAGSQEEVDVRGEAVRS